MSTDQLNTQGIAVYSNNAEAIGNTLVRINRLIKTGATY